MNYKEIFDPIFSGHHETRNEPKTQPDRIALINSYVIERYSHYRAVSLNAETPNMQYAHIMALAYSDIVTFIRSLDDITATGRQ